MHSCLHTWSLVPFLKAMVLPIPPSPMFPCCGECFLHLTSYQPRELVVNSFPGFSSATLSATSSMLASLLHWLPLPLYGIPTSPATCASLQRLEQSPQLSALDGPPRTLWEGPWPATPSLSLLTVFWGCMEGCPLRESLTASYNDVK